MQVDIQVKGVAKPLDESHGSALRAQDSAVLASPASERAKHGLDKNAEDLAHHQRVIREAVTRID